MSASLISGRFLRQHLRHDHKNIVQEKANAREFVSNWASALTEEQGERLGPLIAFLTVALRSRYSGLSDDPDRRFFQDDRHQLSLDTLTKYLTDNFFIPYQNPQILSNVAYNLCLLCTHRHTTLTPVLSLTKGATQLLLDLQQDPKACRKLMKSAKNALEQNLSHLDTTSPDLQQLIPNLFQRTSTPPAQDANRTSPTNTPPQQPGGRDMLFYSSPLQQTVFRTSKQPPSQEHAAPIAPLSLNTDLYLTTDSLLPQEFLQAVHNPDSSKHKLFLKLIQLLNATDKELHPSISSSVCRYFGFTLKDLDFLHKTVCGKNSHTRHFFHQDTYFNRYTKAFLYTLNFTDKEIQQTNAVAKPTPDTFFQQLVKSASNDELRTFCFQNIVLKIDFSRRNLEGISFQGSDVKRCQFDHANLIGTQFTRASLSLQNFKNANFSHTHLEGASIETTCGVPNDSWPQVFLSLNSIQNLYHSLKGRTLTQITKKIMTLPENERNFILENHGYILLKIVKENNLYQTDPLMRFAINTLFLQGTFVDERLREKFWPANTTPGPLKPHQRHLLSLENAPWFYRTYAGSINQLITAYLKHPNPLVKADGERLLAKYLEHIPADVQRELTAASLILTGEERNGMVLPVGGDKPENKNRFVAFALDYYEKLVLEAPYPSPVTWPCFMLVGKNRENNYTILNRTSFYPNDILNAVPLLRRPFAKAQKHSHAIFEFFDRLGLDENLLAVVKGALHHAQSHIKKSGEKFYNPYKGPRLVPLEPKLPGAYRAERPAIIEETAAQQCMALEKQFFERYITIDRLKIQELFTLRLRPFGFTEFFDEDGNFSYEIADFLNYMKVEDQEDRSDKTGRQELSIKRSAKLCKPLKPARVYPNIGTPLGMFWAYDTTISTCAAHLTPKCKAEDRIIQGRLRDRHHYFLSDRVERLLNETFLCLHPNLSKKGLLLSLAGVFLKLGSEHRLGSAHDALMAFRYFAVACVNSILLDPTQTLSDRESDLFELISLHDSGCMGKKCLEFFDHAKEHYYEAYTLSVPPLWQY